MLHAYIYPSKIKKERASGPRLKASVTVEAALTVPVFLFAVLCLVFLLEIRSIRTKVAFAAGDAAKAAACDAALFSVINPFKIKNDMIAALGEDRVDRSIIRGGSEGIHCLKSYFSPFTDEVHVIVEYSVSLPFPYLYGLRADLREEVKVRGWTGSCGEGRTAEDEKIVYVTKDSPVYHERRDCTHLRLSIRFIPFEELNESRNIYGGKYYKCDRCVHGEPIGGVYVTDGGSKYHSTLNCGGLKRTVYAVRKSEVKARRGCSRCSR